MSLRRPASVVCQGGPLVDLHERVATSISHEVYVGTTCEHAAAVLHTVLTTDLFAD